MLSGVSIICFAASYAIVLALEVSRLLFRSAIRGTIMLAWAGAGLFAHTVYLYYQAVNTSGPPLSSWRDWNLVAAWLLMVVYLYLLSFHPRTSIGIFLLPLVLGLTGAAAFLVGSEPFAHEPASKVWGAIHGSALAAAVVSMLVGFAAGVMYLGQVQRLKHKKSPGQGLRLPSLEWLEKINQRAMVIALITLGVGVLAGMILNLIYQRPQAEGLPWYDPLVLCTLLLFFWLLAVTVIGHLYNLARQGKKAVYLSLLSFLLMVIALSAGLLLNTQHGGKRIHNETSTKSQQLENSAR